MNAAVADTRRVQRLMIEGELTVQSATERRTALLDGLRKPYAITELDLSRVEEIDTAGVQLLFLAGRVAMSVGGALRIVAESDAVRDTIDLLQMREFLRQCAENMPQPAEGGGP